MSRATVLLRWKETRTVGVWAGYCGGEGCGQRLAVYKWPTSSLNIQLEPGYWSVDATEMVYRRSEHPRDRFIWRGRKRKHLGQDYASFFGVPGARQEVLRRPGLANIDIECWKCGARNRAVPLPDPLRPGVFRNGQIIRWKRQIIRRKSTAQPPDEGLAQGSTDVL